MVQMGTMMIEPRGAKTDDDPARLATDGMFLFLVIGMPLIVLFFCWVAGLAIYRRRKRIKRAKAKARERLASTAGDTQSLGGRTL
jgi:hypothetical protein